MLYNTFSSNDPAMTTITLTLDTWKYKALLDALNDHERTWRDMLWDAENGKRPAMSPEGAKMFIADLEDLIEQVGCQSID
jgi:hypothetical protein